MFTSPITIHALKIYQMSHTKSTFKKQYNSAPKYILKTVQYGKSWFVADSSKTNEVLTLTSDYALRFSHGFDDPIIKVKAWSISTGFQMQAEYLPILENYKGFELRTTPNGDYFTTLVYKGMDCVGGTFASPLYGEDAVLKAKNQIDTEVKHSV